MLEARVNFLSTKLLVDALAVRRNELDFYSFSLNAIILASTALYMGALGVWGGYLFPFEDWNYGQRFVYHVVMISAMMIHFVCLVIAVIVVIMAPGLALRGPPGSLDRAIDGMRYITWKLAQLLIVSLVLFQIALMMYCWTQPPEGITGAFPPFPIYTSVLVNCVFFAGFVVAAWYGRKIYNLLYFEETGTNAATGLVGAASGFAAAANLPGQPASPQMVQPVFQQQSQVNVTASVTYQTQAAAQADDAIRSVATKPKQKGLLKQLWTGST